MAAPSTICDSSPSLPSPPSRPLPSLPRHVPRRGRRAPRARARDGRHARLTKRAGRGTRGSAPWVQELSSPAPPPSATPLPRPSLAPVRACLLLHDVQRLRRHLGCLAALAAVAVAVVADVAKRQLPERSHDVEDVAAAVGARRGAVRCAARDARRRRLRHPAPAAADGDGCGVGSRHRCHAQRRRPPRLSPSRARRPAGSVRSLSDKKLGGERTKGDGGRTRPRLRGG
eukprot:356913-Chlamydomonas_euryale.AAC.9